MSISWNRSYYKRSYILGNSEIVNRLPRKSHNTRRYPGQEVLWSELPPRGTLEDPFIKTFA